MSSHRHDQLDTSEVEPLTSQQKQLVQQLRQKILTNKDLPVNDPHIRVWLEDTQAFKRFLIARDWNLGISTIMLEAAIRWRFEYKPWTITAGDIEDLIRTGRIYCETSDNLGHSCVYMRQQTSPDNFKDDVCMKYMIWSFEMSMFKTITSTKGERYKMIWFVSNEGYNSKYMKSMKFVRELGFNVQNYYPESLYHCYFFHAPIVFHKFWDIIKNFVDPVTRKKFTFVSSGDEPMLKDLSTKFDMNTVEDEFFGSRSSKTWNPDLYIKECRAIESSMSAYYKKRMAEILSMDSKKM